MGVLSAAALRVECATQRGSICYAVRSGAKIEYLKRDLLRAAAHRIEYLGVALLFPNIRGSSGYGKTFVSLDNGPLRENAYRDIGTLLDWIETQPDLD